MAAMGIGTRIQGLCRIRFTPQLAVGLLVALLVGISHFALASLLCRETGPAMSGNPPRTEAVSGAGVGQRMMEND